ncbi:RNA polymerase II accessory factor, Cdc73 [Beauveria brongniartii RCEF 3172]|uniref:RNA polymerase II accessory factor, Cdc73 n=1 Tax=Beauveria brongniartii RCEF 3172 TaxID=1081107 RepID=A0A167DIA7_9HYPO|nr:RNA polymerase II accessory factor, Cdc73 [Beauveria brongniartii RCEF 3172]
MTSSLLQRPWSLHAGSSGETNYFSLPMQAFSSSSPFLFMDIVMPSPADMNESLRQSMWKPLGAVGAATDAAIDAASSPPPTSPTQNTGSSPPFAIDPPRPPREGYE